MRGEFPDRYGGWAVVAGASVGLGAAFARAVASRGMNLLLVARRMSLLESLAEDFRRQFNVEVRCLECDLGTPGFVEILQRAVSELDVGLAVYNAAYAPVGEFVAMDPADLSRVVDVNVRGPVALLRALLPAMVARKRGAVILMSSLAGNQGTPTIATYAASKAFNKVLAEGLWHELKGQGIDVIACCAGAVRTPGYASAAGGEAPGALDPDIVAERTIRALGRGPLVIPGFVNQLASWIMVRLLPRRAAIGIMALSTDNLNRTQRTQARS
jgi:short-subunit dehydrogenase